VKGLHRLKEAWNKVVFCYTVTKGFPSFLSLIWFTKLYRLRKKSTIDKSYRENYFSISLVAFPGKKIFLRTYAGDIDIFYEIFFTEIYKLDEISDDVVVIDAGANVGFAALYFLNKMSNATVYCIEPDPDNFIFLQKNLKAELESGQIKTVLAGLSDKDGFMNLQTNGLKYNASLVKTPSKNAIEVNTYTVETFLKKYVPGRVNIFKIDIEGAEESIFASDISWLKKVDAMLIEFHSEKIQKMCFEKLLLQNFYFEPQIERANTDVFMFRKKQERT
jgi:FkbM family methyltransferase